MALVPAYGRDYKTEAEVTEAYLRGEDFKIQDISSPYDGRYCSCRDFPGQAMELRFDKLEGVTVVTAPGVK